MRPVRTEQTDRVYAPAGGDEDQVSPLPVGVVEVEGEDGGRYLAVDSYWEFEEEEVERISRGGKVRLRIISPRGISPMQMEVVE